MKKKKNFNFDNLDGFFDKWSFCQKIKLYSDNNEIMGQNTLKNGETCYYPKIFKNSNKNIYYELYVDTQKDSALLDLDYLLLDESKIIEVHNNEIITTEKVIELKNDIIVKFSTRGSKEYNYDCFDDKYNDVCSEFPLKTKESGYLYKIFKNKKLVSGFYDSGCVYGLGDSPLYNMKRYYIKVSI